MKKFDSRRYSITVSAGLPAADLFSSPESPVKIQASLEIGYLSILSHRLQLDSDGTYFDYVEDGGQDVWFPFRRLSLDVSFGPRHKVIFLYQPIDIRTEVGLASPVVVNDATFNGATELRYGFDFYRISYLYDFWRDDRNELAIGASLQIRDAVITFAEKSGADLVYEGNVGPVPALKLRVKYYLDRLFWIGAEMDGLYAAGRGRDGLDERRAATLSAPSLTLPARGGFSPRDNIDVFLNLRYLGGGAEGGSSDDSGPGDGYTKNWLHTFGVSVGVNVR